MIQTSIILILSILLIILLSAKYKLNTFFILITIALAVGLITQSSSKVVESIKIGFGHTLEKVVLLIIFGTALGLILEKTRATQSLAQYIIQKTGENNKAIAITIIGFTIGLPIFCDSGFIILSGLVLSLSQNTKGKHLIYTGCLATSLFGVHCMVPPHPGITAAVGILNVDLGKAMLLNSILAIPAIIVGYYWSLHYGKKYDLDITEIKKTTNENTILPKPIFAIIPIVIPILLIAIKSILGSFHIASENLILPFINFIGEPVIALLVGLICCAPILITLASKEINEILEEAIEKAGPILAIIAAGGAFGEIIKGMDLGKIYGGSIGDMGLSIFAPFILAAIFKTAQGSSTVASISTASIILPLLGVLQLDTEFGKLLTLASIGAGSMFFSHANDAYFWVITRFSNITTKQTYAVFSTASVVMSLTTLAFIFLLKLLLV